MKINGAWYVNEFPTAIVLELPDGSLAHIALTPFRHIFESDLRTYKGHHPRKMKGQPVPGYLYHFYGLEKSDESLSEVIRVRVSPSEKTAFEAYSASLEPKQNVSDVIREFIRSKI
jgi:hypothetical protein